MPPEDRIKGQYIIVPKNPIKVLPPETCPDPIIFGPHCLKPELVMLIVLVFGGFAEMIGI
jgi:hypothetical protein